MAITEMSEDDSEKKLESTRKFLFGLAIVGAGITVAAFATYLLNFYDRGISDSPAQWGPFGDFIGGVLNPIVGLLALFGLLWTIFQNQQELYLTRKELAKSSQALQDSKDIAEAELESIEKKARKDDFHRTINLLHDELHADLSKEIAAEGTRHGGQYVVWNPERGELPSRFSDTFMRKELGAWIEIAFASTQLWKELYGVQKSALDKIALRVTGMVTYLKAFEHEAGDGIVTDYYRERISPIAKTLEQYGRITPETRDYYRILKGWPATVTVTGHDPSSENSDP